MKTAISKMTSNQEVYRQRLSESWLSHKGCSTEQDDADAHVQLGIRLSLAASRLRFFLKRVRKPVWATSRLSGLRRGTFGCTPEMLFWPSLINARSAWTKCGQTITQRF